MLSKPQVWTIVGIACLIWLALIGAGVVTDNLDAFARISSLVPILLGGAALFERWGWRWNPLHPHIVRTPVLRGTWRGLLRSEWVDPETEQGIPPKTVYLSVDQTLQTVRTRLLTDESASEQVAGTISERWPGQLVLTSIYVNTAQIHLRPKSPTHGGGLLLTLYAEPRLRLEGEYWTERLTKGSLDFRDHSSTVAESYEHAASLDYGQPSEAVP